MSKRNRELSRSERAAQAVREQQAAERRRRMLAIGGVVLVLVVIVGGAFWLTRSADTTGEIASDEPTVAESSGGGVAGEVDGYGVKIGDPDAAEKVTIYEDLQCPACASLEGQLGDSIAQAVDDGEIQLEYRMVAFLDGASTNEYSSRALNAALVVLNTSGVEAFRAFHDDLYANQPAEGGPGLEDAELIDRAVDAGAEEDAVRPGIEDKVFDQWIVNATDQMSKDGVRGTPSIEINGEEAEPQELLELLQ